MQDRPTAIELVTAASEFVERELVPIAEGARQFQTRVVANVLKIVAREIEMGETLMRSEVDALAVLLNEAKPHLHTTSDVRAAAVKMNEILSEKIRKGEIDHDPARADAMKVVRQIVEDKLRIANPRYLEDDLRLRSRSKA